MIAKLPFQSVSKTGYIYIYIYADDLAIKHAHYLLGTSLFNPLSDDHDSWWSIYTTRFSHDQLDTALALHVDVEKMVMILT